VKVLWVKSELLHPVDKGGKIRTFEMLRHLMAGHEVTYLCLSTPSDAPDARERAAEYCQKLHTVPWSEPPRFSRGALSSHLVREDDTTSEGPRE
jgi:hypothetical protein